MTVPSIPVLSAAGAVAGPVVLGTGVAVVAGGTGYIIGSNIPDGALEPVAVCVVAVGEAAAWAGGAIGGIIAWATGDTGVPIPGSETIHYDHPHGGMQPHRHWLEKHKNPKTGQGRTVRRTGRYPPGPGEPVVPPN